MSQDAHDFMNAAPGSVNYLLYRVHEIDSRLIPKRNLK